MNTVESLADKLHSDIVRISAAVDVLRGDPPETTIRALYLHAHSLIAIQSLRELRGDALDRLNSTFVELKFTA